MKISFPSEGDFDNEKNELREISPDVLFFTSHLTFYGMGNYAKTVYQIILYKLFDYYQCEAQDDIHMNTGFLVYLGGRGHTPIYGIWICAAEKGMVFRQFNLA